MAKRYLLITSIALVTIFSYAQDYAPFYLGNEWIFEILIEDGSVIGTDTMRCEAVRIVGDTTFYDVYSYTNYDEGSPNNDTVELNIFYDGVGDTNDVFIRVFMGGANFIDALYFKHTYIPGEIYGNMFFSVTAYDIGTFNLPSGSYPDCFWLEVADADSTGFVLAPDLGIIATMEDGVMTRALKGSNLPPVTHEKISFCQGDSIWLHDRYISQEGIYRDTLIGGEGGDSIIVTTVAVWPPSEATEEVWICPGETYFAGGADRSEPGTYYDTLVNAHGCDSILITILTLLPTHETNDDVTICQGDTYFAGGADQSEPGTYYDTLVNAYGCDSVMVTHLAVEECPTVIPGSIKEKKLGIYPNPTSGMLHIESANLVTIEIYNIFGKLVHRSGNKQFDFSGLPEGCYYLKCYDLDQEVTVRKVIHQK